MKTIKLFPLLLCLLILLTTSTIALAQSSAPEVPIASSELSLDAGDKIKGVCVCFPKGHPDLGTIIGKNISVNECCKRQSKTTQCNVTEPGGRVWGCLDKKTTSHEDF